MLLQPRALLALDVVMPKLIVSSSPAAPDFWGTVQELSVKIFVCFNRMKNYFQKIIKMIELYKISWKVFQTYYFETNFAPKCKCTTLFNISRGGEHFAHRRILLCKHNIAKWNLKAAVCEIWSWVWQWFSLPWTLQAGHNIGCVCVKCDYSNLKSHFPLFALIWIHRYGANWYTSGIEIIFGANAPVCIKHHPIFSLARNLYMFIKVAHNVFQSFFKWNLLTEVGIYCENSLIFVMHYLF